VGNVACMRKMRMNTTFWLEYVERRDHLGELGVTGRLILKLVLKE